MGSKNTKIGFHGKQPKLGMIPLILDGVTRFNMLIDDIVKKLIPRCSAKELLRYHLYATQSRFNPELSDKAQVLVRLANKGKVQAMKEQDMPLIHQAFQHYCSK